MSYLNFFRSQSQNSSSTSTSAATRWFFKIGAHLTVVSLFTTLLPLPPASAIRFTRNRDSYRLCAQELLSVGVSPETAAAACAAAFHPADISQCVTRINRTTQIPAMDALSSCRRVRRPYELVNCTVDISTRSKTQPAAPLSVMDFCRRSLLPERFSECVIGLSNRVNFPTERLMNTCIDARNELGQIEPFAPPVPAPLESPPPVPGILPSPPVQ